MTSSLIS